MDIALLFEEKRRGGSISAPRGQSILTPGSSLDLTVFKVTTAMFNVAPFSLYQAFASIES